MFDHIGPGSQRTCTKMVVSCLVADSLFLLRIIYTSTDPDCRRPRDQQVHFSRWPVAGQIDAAAGGACITGDWQNFGTRYIPTQVAWLTNAEARREELRQLGYDDRFQRMCATFCCRLPVLSARRNRLWQIVCNKKGLVNDYNSNREETVVLRLLWNLFALLGLALVALLIAAVVQTGPAITNLAGFDSNAARTYGEIAQKLVASGSGPEATVWKIPVQDGLTPEEVEDTMRFVANEHNIKNVGELPLYKEVEAISGKPFRFLKIYMFCNAMTAARMLDLSDAFSAYLPCRISMVEDKSGKLWLYTLNMDLMIYGGKTLPEELKVEAIKVKDIILDIMNRGASGEF